MPWNPSLFPDPVEEKKECSLKILIPSSAVGSIMGKSGESVHGLELSTGTKITISALKDVYPGTKDRVCLISGTVESVSRVNRIIMDKMAATRRNCCNTQGGSSSRPKHQVKLIIPQSTASKVIGKAGTTVEKMKSGSGSFIQLSRKAFPVMLRERCVTVRGEPPNIDMACRMILKIIADETNADYYKNVSYSEANFPLPNAFMSGPPIARAKYNMKPDTIPESSISRRDLTLFLEQLKDNLGCMGYPEETVRRTAECLLTLNDHRVMDICLSFMINWFYPRAYSVYERNRGVVGRGKAPPTTSPPPGSAISSGMFVNPPNGSCPEHAAVVREQSGFDRSLAPSAQALCGAAAAGRNRGFQTPVPTASAFPALCGAAAAGREHGFQTSVSAAPALYVPAGAQWDRGIHTSVSAASALSDAAAALRDHGIQKYVSAPTSAALQPRPENLSRGPVFNSWSTLQSNAEGFSRGNTPSTTASIGSTFRYW